MNEFRLILERIGLFKTSILADPYGNLPILSDNLRDDCGSLGEEAANAIDYWVRTRLDLDDRGPKWEEWLLRVMAKYGAIEEVRTHNGRGVQCTLRGRLLTFWTEAEFTREIIPEYISGHPIKLITIREANWYGFGLLEDKCVSQVDKLVLDFRESTNAFMVGVVRAIECLTMPQLRKIMVYSHEARRGEYIGLKGKVGVALAEAVEQRRIPKGTEFWWNDRRT